MRVEIAGALSCGKSTLAGKLSDLGKRIVYEDLSTNPYLDLRVEDPEKYDFLCQQQFVLDKIASIRNAREQGHDFFCDFSIAAERAYVSHYVSHRPDWIGRLNGLMDESEDELGLPDVLVYLRCAAEAQLDRIKVRGRSFEQGHDVAFIETINEKVDRQVARLVALRVPVLEYRTDLMSWHDIMDDIQSKLGGSAAGEGMLDTRVSSLHMEKTGA